MFVKFNFQIYRSINRSSYNMLRLIVYFFYHFIASQGV